MKYLKPIAIILLALVSCLGPDGVPILLNNPPTALDDNAEVAENDMVSIDVLANDSDSDNDLISVASVSTPANGTAFIVPANGQIEYTPGTDYLGTDEFTYTIEDSFGAQATATVYIVVAPVGMASIPGGTFEMGDHAGVGGGDELPVHSVTLDALYMDKYEVSNTKFADYLNNSTVSVISSDVYQVGGAGALICLLANGLSYDGSTFSVDVGKENHPVIYQTWYGAALYCNYLSTLNGRTPCYNETTFACNYAADGFRLPTEAEWEYASRGGEHNPYYQYPWSGDSITSSDANYDNGPNTTVNVGNYAANGYGLYDMAGNAWEWCNDWYDFNYYSSSSPTNPTGPASGTISVFRGGGFNYSGGHLRSANRNGGLPSSEFNDVGFRVVMAQ